MYKFLTKNGQLLAFGLGIVVTALFLIMVFSGMSEFSALAEEERGQTNIFNFGLFASAFLVLAGVAAMFVFGILQVVGDVKGSMKGIIGLVAIVVIFFIARSIGSDDTPIQDTITEFKVTNGQSSFITGAIMASIVMAGLAAITFVISEVRNFFK
ncbi:MAG: hypothetical protein AAFV95_25980 [Bacteroidota bacterium]